MDPIFSKETNYLLDHPALANIPNEITLLFLQNLKNCQDASSFMAINHAASNMRPHLWFIWAKEYGYTGDLEGSQKHLRLFFATIAKIAYYRTFPTSWRVLVKDGTPRLRINGYLTAEKFLNTPLSELQFFFNNQWVYHVPELLFLARKASGTHFREILNPCHIKTELLNTAATHGNLLNIQILCELVEDPNLLGMKFAPIHAAAKAGHGNAIRLLVAYGASVSAEWKRVELQTTPYNYHVVEHFHTPLDLAYNSNNEDAVKALLEAKADPNKEFINSCTNAHLRMLKIFLKSAPSCPVNEGLKHCFENAHPQTLHCAELLLKYGANPDITNSRNETLLYRAVKKGDVNFTHLLCQFAAKTEMRNIENKAPLYIAIKETSSKVKRLELIRILCAHGANIHALDPKGKRTLFQHAAKSKELKDLLSSKEQFDKC